MNETLTPAYISEIARTIFQQLKSTTTFSVRGSWAAQNYQASVYKGMPALTFRVSGLRHKGRVYIAYNERAAGRGLRGCRAGRSRARCRERRGGAAHRAG